ncbi:LPS assembly lipoprotein LptE [Rhizobium sp. RU20A]|uniref:LPS assembly lipoprotein LptE n=1 Tax=Rhizobium sp. RU20A TaxID=1907412 RepID=UPI00122C3191|nr:LPS assembly lipoprotein LptE [Rhizobium sp. RU20A]
MARHPLARRAFLAAALAVSLASLSGCQVRPLYSSDGQTAEALKSIVISEARDRVEQEVRNSLIFLLAGGAGEPANPAYRLELTVTNRLVGVLFDSSTDLAAAGRVVVKADFNLIETATGKTIRSGNRASVALVDLPNQEFAKVRAIRDAESRAARELAEIIRADLSAAVAAGHSR